MRKIEHNGVTIFTNDKYMSAEELLYNSNGLNITKALENKGDIDGENKITNSSNDLPLVEMSYEQLAELSIECNKTFDEFQKKSAKIVNKEMAAFIRFLRVIGVNGSMYSWRRIARVCYDQLKGDWNPPSNQLMGMALCEASAKFFNEDYEKEPWN